MFEDQDNSATEGLFDAQLALPLACATVAEPFSTVIKRDGRVERFETEKIASAIARASASAAPGEGEHAWDLAKAVRVHLWKQLGERPPHVDEVHSAVERVLVSMARQRTALAYVRYRIRRSRKRSAASGRTVSQGPLEEDGYLREALGGRSDALLVRTSTDTLTVWDRGKIVAALSRETGLRENTAEAIALEVEQQIAAAHIDALTASLVRELVDAKLAEHGLGEYRERHRRLGVPLYDTALMLRGIEPAGAGRGPNTADRLLARVVKKEYALAEVFSAPVAEAHLRGDLHVDGLGDIDRYGGATLPLSAIGAGEWPVFPAGSALPRFLARWRQTGRLLRGFLQTPCAWRDDGTLDVAMNGVNDETARQAAEMFLFEYAQADKDSPPFTLHLGWPGEATPPGQARFCRALLDTLTNARALGVTFSGLMAEVVISPPLFSGYPPHEDLGRLVRAAVAGVPIRYSFHRGNTDPPASKVWMHTIVLNLPRAARHAGDLGGAEAWLRSLLQVAAVAHEEKRTFMEELWARGGGGPLAVLQASSPLEAFLPEHCVTRIAIDGLFDAARILAPDTLEVAESADALLRWVRAACETASDSTGARFRLCANSERLISQRFASLESPLDEGLFASNDAESPPTFSPGMDLPPQRNPVEAAFLHGKLGAHLDEPPTLAWALETEDYSADSIAGLLQKILLQTDCAALVFLPRTDTA